MKKIPVTKLVNLQLLTEELFNAFPSWYDVMDVSVRAEYVRVPDDADETAVQAVIDAHDPTGLSINQKRKNLEKDLAERIERHFPQFSIEELRLMFPRIEFEDA